MTELETKKTDWDANHLKIIDAYTDFVDKNSKAPKVSELCVLTSLTRPTIYKHLKKMQLTEISNKFKIRAMTILEGVCKKAEEGDVQAAKLLLNLTFGWNEKTIVENKNTNRTLKITFTNPTAEDLKKITDDHNTVEDIDYTEED